METNRKQIKRFAEPAFPMTANEFRLSLSTLHITQSAFARWIKVTDRTVRTWIKGQYPVPMTVSYLLALMKETDRKPEDIKL